MSKTTNISNAASNDIRQERQDFIIAGQPYKSAIECAERFYNNFTFRNQGAATDAFRSSLENIQNSHSWVAAFLRESSTADFKTKERSLLKKASNTKIRQQLHALPGALSRATAEAAMTAIETNRKLNNAGSKIITKRALGLFDKMESSTSDTGLSWRRGSPGLLVNDPFVSSDEYDVHSQNPFIAKEHRHKRAKESAELPESTEPPESPANVVSSLIPDLDVFATLNQDTTWMEDEIDMLSVFERFAAIEGSYSLVQDHIADMTEGSSFVRSLSNEEYSMACLPTFGAPSIATKWPTFQPVVHRVLRSSFSFDEVFSAIKDESFRDPFVEYIHAICYSYDHYFHFRDTIPETLNEREGFADTTWSIIRGALKLANVSSRFLEVPVVGVEVRKNANKNLLEEIKEQAHQADGVGYLDSERSQIYLAESSVLHLPDTRKRILDEIKVKRDMRDTLIAQLAEFSRESLPPRGFSVFGSTSFGPHTKFYQMDIAGVFRVYQVGSMLIPLTKEGFASKLRRCITTALRFALRIGDERDRRLMAEDLSELDKQRLQRACSQVSQTSKTPTGGRNQKKKQ